MDSQLLAVFYTLLLLVIVALIWDTQRQNRKAHIRTQEILRDIARFLGTDRR